MHSVAPSENDTDNAAPEKRLQSDADARASKQEQIQNLWRTRDPAIAGLPRAVGAGGTRLRQRQRRDFKPAWGNAPRIVTDKFLPSANGAIHPFGIVRDGVMNGAWSRDGTGFQPL